MTYKSNTSSAGSSTGSYSTSSSTKGYSINTPSAIDHSKAIDLAGFMKKYVHKKPYEINPVKNNYQNLGIKTSRLTSKVLDLPQNIKSGDYSRFNMQTLPSLPKLSVYAGNNQLGYNNSKSNLKYAA